jgi:hypothetical protein
VNEYSLIEYKDNEQRSQGQERSYKPPEIAFILSIETDNKGKLRSHSLRGEVASLKTIVGTFVRIEMNI